MEELRDPAVDGPEGQLGGQASSSTSAQRLGGPGPGRGRLLRQGRGLNRALGLEEADDQIHCQSKVWTHTFYTADRY